VLRTRAHAGAKRSAAPGRLLLLSLLVVASGCRSGSSSTDIQPWQRGVEQYLAQKNNDPEALREVTLEDSRRGFAVLGGLDPRKSTDQRGLLVAHKVVGDRPWFVYVVGVVKNDVVQNLRLVALSAAGGQTLWRVGERDPQAFKLYHDHALNDWRQQSGDHGKPPVQYTTFPRASDVFDVTVEGTLIRAKHVASGAQFAVDVAAPAPVANNAKKTKKQR
jgi:hypothetical protein